jgi:hypothetical protein
MRLADSQPRTSGGAALDIAFCPGIRPEPGSWRFLNHSDPPGLPAMGPARSTAVLLHFNFRSTAQHCLCSFTSDDHGPVDIREYVAVQ